MPSLRESGGFTAYCGVVGGYELTQHLRNDGRWCWYCLKPPDVCRYCEPSQEHIISPELPALILADDITVLSWSLQSRHLRMLRLVVRARTETKTLVRNLFCLHRDLSGNESKGSTNPIERGTGPAVDSALPVPLQGCTLSLRMSRHNRPLYGFHWEGNPRRYRTVLFVGPSASART